jgi:hypothetical protein
VEAPDHHRWPPLDPGPSTSGLGLIQVGNQPLDGPRTFELLGRQASPREGQVASDYRDDPPAPFASLSVGWLDLDHTNTETKALTVIFHADGDLPRGPAGRHRPLLGLGAAIERRFVIRPRGR